MEGIGEVKYPSWNKNQIGEGTSNNKPIIESSNNVKLLPQVCLQNLATDSDRMKAMVVGAGPMEFESVNHTLVSVNCREGQTMSAFYFTGQEGEDWASVKSECGKLKEELLLIRVQIKVMFDACQKQKNICQAVKDSIRSVKKHMDNTVHCQERITLCTQRRGQDQKQ